MTSLQQCHQMEQKIASMKVDEALSFYAQENVEMCATGVVRGQYEERLLELSEWLQIKIEADQN